MKETPSDIPLLLEKISELDSFIEILLNEIADAVFYQGSDLLYHYANEAYCRLVGKPMDQVMGHDIFHVFPIEEAEVYHLDDMEIIKSGHQNLYEAEMIEADGSTKTIQVTKTPHFNEAGQVIGILGIIKDMTAIRENERQLKMLDQVKDIFLDINKNILNHPSEQAFFDDIQMEIQSIFNQCKQSCVLSIDKRGDMSVLVSCGYVSQEARNFHMPLTESYMFKHSGGDFTSAFYINDVQYYLEENSIPIITSHQVTSIHATLCIPLIIENELKYIITLDSSLLNAFNETDRLVAEFIGKELPIIYRIFDLHRETVKLSKYDELTGLYNRRYFNEVADTVMNQLQDQDTYTLLIADMDHLKQVNDEYGHIAGDQYIIELVKGMAHLQSENAKFGRIGGDEFAGYFLGYDYQVVKELMNTLQKNFENKVIQVGETTFSGRFSYGLAFYPQDGRSRSELMKVADMRMYKDKHPV